MRFRGRAGSIRVVAATAVALGGFALVGGVAATSAGAVTPPKGCPPKVTSVTAKGEKNGITPISIHGQCLNYVTSVAFGGTSVSVSGKKQIQSEALIVGVLPPAEAAGTVNVTVTSPSGPGGPGGTSAVNAAATYTYYAPTLTKYGTGKVGILGGQTITISGKALDEPGKTPAVEFGTTPATSVRVLNEEALRVVVPAHNAGATTVSVTTTAGTGSGPFVFVYKN